MNYAEARAEVIRYGQLLVEHQLIQATWGNVSLRVDEDPFLISPSGVDYFRAKPEEVVLVMAQAEATGTPEAVQQFSDLLNSVGFAENNSDNQLRQIILENGLLYCQGSKSLDETIKLIQSKASLYLAEHYN